MNTKNNIFSKFNSNLRILVLGLFLQSFIFSATYYVDGSVTGGSCSQSDPCELIQTAIDLAIVDGDVVIVTGGMTYEENLLIETGITLKSADPGVPATIDGSNYDNGSNGSCIIIRSPSGSTTRINTTIEDMIITGGTGTLVNEDVDHDGNYNGPDDVQKRVGGGILIHNASMTSRGNKIKNNGDGSTKEGGGTYAAGNAIDIDDENPDLPPPVFNTRSTIIFDETVFEDNAAQIGHTLMANAWDNDGRSIVIDFSGSTFDVAYDSEDNEEDGVCAYWVNGKDNPTFDFSGGISGQGQAIIHDVWVDPVNGEDDENTSGSIEQPFKTIDYAMSMIYPTEENPVTIHLEEGTYDTNTESFPLTLFNYINLMGESADGTLLDGNSNINKQIIHISYSEGINISNLTVKNGCGTAGGGIFIKNSQVVFFDMIISDNGLCSTTMAGGGIVAGNSDLYLSNVLVKDNLATLGGGIYLEETRSIMNNVTIIDNISHMYYGGLYLIDINLATNDTTFITDVIISNNEAIEDDGYNGGGGIAISGMSFPVFNRVLINNNSADFGGGIFIGNINDGYDRPSPIIYNSTITNNNSDGIYINDADPIFINTIIWDNGSQSIYLSEDFEGTIDISYSDIQGGYEGDSNIDANPLFCDLVSGDFTLSENSPCIGSGQNGTNMGALGIGCESSGCISGDANSDEDINVLDIVIMVNMILNGSDYIECIDMNGDSAVNVLDVVMVINLILN